MAYTALYRRYRPNSFSELVGQMHIAKTLTHAVAQGSFSHAYLFCGPRGTGKTSTARIVAKAINCLDPQNGEPCCKCQACLRIAGGASMDITEIDAASNRGIDEIRDLRESVKYAPVQEKYKIYIIDEVHALTGDANNAFLKTLEEPPAHVIFILATTEPHRLPVTVLSRCQRFDFHRISEQDIRQRLAYIAELEGFTVTSSAAAILAKKAEGGLRDAVNLLDQCAVFGDGKIDEITVAKVLGLVDGSFTAALAEAVLKGDLPALLKMLDELNSSGKDLRAFLFDLLDYLRAELLKAYDNQDNARGAGLLKAITALAETDSHLRYSLQQRITLELALLQAGSFLEGVKAAARSSAAKASPTAAAPKPVSARASSPPEPPAAQATVKAKSSPPEPKTAELPVIEDEMTAERIKMLWPRIIKQVERNDDAGTMGFFQWAEAGGLKGNKLTLLFEPDFATHAKAISQRPQHRAVIERALSEICGKEMAFDIKIQAKAQPKELEQGNLNL